MHTTFTVPYKPWIPTDTETLDRWAQDFQRANDDLRERFAARRTMSQDERIADQGRHRQEITARRAALGWGP